MNLLITFCLSLKSWMKNLLLKGFLSTTFTFANGKMSTTNEWTLNMPSEKICLESMKEYEEDAEEAYSSETLCEGSTLIHKETSEPEEIDAEQRRETYMEFQQACEDIKNGNIPENEDDNDHGFYAKALTKKIIKKIASK